MNFENLPEKQQEMRDRVANRRKKRSLEEKLAQLRERMQTRKAREKERAAKIARKVRQRNVKKVSRGKLKWKQCASRSCDKVFPTTRPWVKYCSVKCQRAENHKKWRENRSPEKVELDRLFTRHYMREYNLQHPYTLSTRRHNRQARMRRAGGRHSKAEWLNLVDRLGWKCSYCGVSLTPETLTKDHIVPVSKGGSNNLDNLAPACLRCNASKNNSLDYIEKINKKQKLEKAVVKSRDCELSSKVLCSKELASGNMECKSASDAVRSCGESKTDSASLFSSAQPQSNFHSEGLFINKFSTQTVEKGVR